MASQARGERGKNPGVIERVAANRWQGQLPLADYRNTDEYRKNGSRFDVFYKVELGIRALAAVLIAYQDRRELRAIRGIIAARLRSVKRGIAPRPISAMLPS